MFLIQYVLLLLTCTERLPQPNQFFLIMLLALRIITIIVSVICAAVGILFIVLGLLEKPAEMDAVWVGAIIVFFYFANLYLLYRGYKKKHGPVHWTALTLSILPPLAIYILILLADNLGDLNI